MADRILQCVYGWVIQIRVKNVFVARGKFFVGQDVHCTLRKNVLTTPYNAKCSPRFVVFVNTEIIFELHANIGLWRHFKTPSLICFEVPAELSFKGHSFHLSNSWVFMSRLQKFPQELYSTTSLCATSTTSTRSFESEENITINLYTK